MIFCAVLSVGLTAGDHGIGDGGVCGVSGRGQRQESTAVNVAGGQGGDGIGLRRLE